uniref:Uncharacterized protein n=1 Tax=Eptatretus burgeri TaxID=7764 RepID=A0A8C4QUI6_EPTBU
MELDSLPKEELIKYAKKQMVLLQRLKTKNYEITKELEEKKSIRLENAQVIQDVTERLNQVLSEKAELELRLREEHKRGRQEAEFEMEKALLQERNELERLSGEVQDQAIKHAVQLAELRAQHQENMKQLQQELELRAQGEECDLREQVRRMKEEQDAAEARWKNIDELLEKARVEKEFLSTEVEHLRSQWEVGNEIKLCCELETIELREQLNKLMMRHEEERKMWKEHVKEERSKPDGEVQQSLDILVVTECNSNLVYKQDENNFASESVGLLEEGQHLHQTITGITMEPDGRESHLPAMLENQMQMERNSGYEEEKQTKNEKYVNENISIEMTKSLSFLRDIDIRETKEELQTLEDQDQELLQEHHHLEMRMMNEEDCNKEHPSQRISLRLKWDNDEEDTGRFLGEVMSSVDLKALQQELAAMTVLAANRGELVMVLERQLEGLAEELRVLKNEKTLFGEINHEKHQEMQLQNCTEELKDSKALVQELPKAFQSQALELKSAHGVVVELKSSMGNRALEVVQRSSCICEGEREVEDGRREVEDGRREVEDGRREVEDGRREVEEDRRRVELGRTEVEMKEYWRRVEVEYRRGDVVEQQQQEEEVGECEVVVEEQCVKEMEVELEEVEVVVAGLGVEVEEGRRVVELVEGWKGVEVEEGGKEMMEENMREIAEEEDRREIEIVEVEEGRCGVEEGRHGVEEGRRGVEKGRRVGDGGRREEEADSYRHL